MSRRGLAVTALAVMVGVGTAAPSAYADANNNTSRKLRQAVNADGVFTHLKALQEIADRNNGTRVSGTAGFNESADYAERVFRDAGYTVSRQEFKFQTFISLTPSVLQRTAPGPVTDLTNAIMSYSGSGDVTAAASVPTGAATGCSAANFGPANVGTIVVISRGACTFAAKATNAFNAGAAGVVIYNNVPDMLNGTLGSGFALNIPAVGITQALGAQLVGQVAGGIQLHLKTSTFRGEATTYNIFAESSWGDPDNVVMAGAHLDSVAAGEGINDNGSGAGAILETAVQMKKVHPKNKVRFALWGAEESGLVGSNYYIANLSAEERQKVALYLNFDMVGSPNYVRFVYDGDNSAFPVGPGSAPGPVGSGAIEQLFHDYFASQGLATAETPFSGRSDYGPFIAEGVGIPAGGLFTGAEGIKTAQEAAIFGGTAGAPYDSCYHQACDDLNNINVQGLDEMIDAVAHAIITYAFDTRSVNGEGNGHPVSPPGQSTGGTSTGAGSSSGGGLHDDHDHAVE